ncbi:CAP domain-containing protein [Paraburkholderia sp. SIMBA_054]|uniref:CAP domain-containing protein n=1 Tax=Paraburkholderia sp. SIMBA_054 TaxID=3085795 RepID=UPI00397D9513
MINKKTILAASVSALAILAGCATKQPPKASAHAPEYTGPVITLHPAPGPTTLSPSPSLPTAIEFVNARRQEVGLPAVAVDDNIAVAAADHARYLQINRASGHDEAVGLPGFTGVDVTSRVRLHTTSEGASETFVEYGGQHTPELPIEDIFNAPMHRGIVFFPWKRAGEASNTGDSAITVVDFSDLAPGLKETELIAYPYDGQDDAPTLWVDLERPDPLGPGYAGQTVGFPLTLSGGANAHIELSAFDLRDKHGKKVKCHIAALTPADAARNTAVCTPLEPLRAGMRYTAHATGHLTQTYVFDRAPFDLTWSFQTASGTSHPARLIAQNAVAR